MSQNVQGALRVFRAEIVMPEALERSPDDLGIPVIRDGYVWRSKDRFRADYKVYNPNSENSKISQQSLAMDGTTLFRYGSTDVIDIATLQIAEIGTQEATEIMKSIELMFHLPLDALWNTGMPLVEILQRPHSRIAPNKTLPEGYSLLMSDENGGDVQFELEARKYYPFGYARTSQSIGDSLVKSERRVFSTEKDGSIFPVRIVDVVSFGADRGYTEVVELDLQPLQENSPIVNPITSSSFRNLGKEYQVYNYKQDDDVQISERIETAKPLAQVLSGPVRSVLLWLNGIVIAILIAVILYRYRRHQKAMRNP